MSLKNVSENKDSSSSSCSPKEGNGCSFNFSSDLSLEQLRDAQHKFVDDRNWHQFHSPRNVLLALGGEVGELQEAFQWKGEVKEGVPKFTDQERVNLEHELSDVLIYMTRLSQLCHIDLPKVIQEKMEQNAVKFPVPDKDS